MPYFAQTDLENALSVNVVKAVYDDDHDGVVDSAPMAACVAYGDAMCNSFLRRVLATSSGTAATLPLTTVPDEVKFAALDFGIAYTIRRRPDVVKAMNEQPWTVFHEQAIEQMKRYCASMQIVPPTTGAQATEGGAILNPDSDSDGNAEDLPDEPRWADFADFA
jgi:hypothetical protein